MNDLGQHFLPPKKNYFVYCVILLCLSYILFEYLFIPYAALAADEFVFARHIYDYTVNIPYRDFAPYKTVLGYYLFSIPLFFSHGFLEPLFYIKDEIALINTACLALSSYWALRFFNRKAILMTLLVLLANQSFLIYSSDLRVDMLTAWFCLFAAFATLQNRFYLSGGLIGIAFLVSQKALWYVFALNGALLICWLSVPASTYSLRALLKLNAAFLLAIVIYIGFWSYFTTPSSLLYNLFYEAYIQAGIDWYTVIYRVCWNAVLYHGPTLFLLWPLSLIGLFGLDPRDKATQQRIFTLSFASIALVLLITYKQPFPYNFVFTMPAFFLLYAEAITAFTKPKNNRLSPFVIALLGVYALAIIGFVAILALPKINYLIALLPLFVALYFSSRLKKYLLRYSMMMVFILTAGIYPLYQSLQQSYHLNGRYQQKMLALASQLLNDDGDYVGGIPFLYQKDQPILGMKNLIGPALEYLFQPSDKIKLLLLPSLYLAPTTPTTILDDLKKSSVKVLIYNYRMLSLPPVLRTYLDQQYQHFYGSLYLYAPTILRQQLTFSLKFTGDYRIEAPAKTKISIDGKRHRTGQTIHLEKGDHLTDASLAYRLQYIAHLPKGELDPAYQNDDWVRMIKAIVT